MSMKTTIGPIFECIHTGKLNDWDLHPFRKESAIPNAFLGKTVFPNLEINLRHTETGERATYYAYVSTEGLNTYFINVPKLDMESVTADLFGAIADVWGRDEYFVDDYHILGNYALPDALGHHPEAIMLQLGLYAREPYVGERDREPHAVKCVVTTASGMTEALEFPLVELYSRLCDDPSAFWSKIDPQQVAKAMRHYLETAGRGFLPEGPSGNLENITVRLNDRNGYA